MELFQASQQWSKRPDDQRFTSLGELHAAVAKRREESITFASPIGGLRVMAEQDGNLSFRSHDPVEDRNLLMQPSNWAFGQLARTAKVPAQFLRRLADQPDGNELAAINLQYGMVNLADSDESLMMVHQNGHATLTSVTSTTYGRIWDDDVVHSIRHAVSASGGDWKIPSASYATRDPKRATTLYASDRDVFVFLVDESRPIEIDGEQLFRGFFAWNSEVGLSSFGLACFLYRFVCDNRIVWGATDVKELRIRHTGGAPDRFSREGNRMLTRYAQESSGVLEGQIRRARELSLTDASNDREARKDLTSFLKQQGFAAKVAESAVAKAEEEESHSNPRSLWSIVQGVTAYARSIPHTDERVALERKAGGLMKRVEA